MRFDSYGKGQDNTALKSGQFYWAKFDGVNNGADKSPPDEKFLPYRAVKTGSLFVLRRAGSIDDDGTIRCRWYHVPELFEVGAEIAEQEVRSYLGKSPFLIST